MLISLTVVALPAGGVCAAAVRVNAPASHGEAATPRKALRLHVPCARVISAHSLPRGAGAAPRPWFSIQNLAMSLRLAIHTSGNCRTWVRNWSSPRARPGRPIVRPWRPTDIILGASANPDVRERAIPGAHHVASALDEGPGHVGIALEGHPAREHRAGRPVLVEDPHDAPDPDPAPVFEDRLAGQLALLPTRG